MSEHSIDELKRQLAQAKSRLKAAQDAYEDAKDLLEEALENETGWLGKKATRVGRSIIVHRVYFRGDKPYRMTGFKLTSDGRPGRVEMSMYIDGEPIEFTDYVPPSNGNGK